jgi:uncharacterized lipoprotein YddW (UPF0748 family)
LKFNKSFFGSVLIIISLFLSACSQDSVQEPVNLLNAQGYEGAEFPVHSAELPQSPPETTTAPEITTTPATTAATPEPATTTAPVATTTPGVAVTTQITTATPRITTTTPPVTTKPPVTPTPLPVRPAVHDEVRGVWISFIELSEAFKGRTEASFRAAFAEMMDNCTALGINTVFVHVRGHGDAYYESELFPWARQITGTVGNAPGFDPLAVMIEEAHSRGISFRAWLNPMRLMTDADMQRVSANFPIGQWYNSSQRGTYIVQVGNNWYLNPAYTEVRQLIADGAAEILRNYNVDGIHIDDYFYPPNCNEAFDRAAFAASEHAGLSEFRLENASLMVKALYDTVKSINPAVLFGISPQGSIENCYAIYADVKRWASEPGFCDYIAPQLYYGFHNALQPFERCLAEWEDLVRNNDIKLLIGLAVYKIGLEDTWAGASGRNEWIVNDDIIRRQTALSRQADNYGGIIYFSYQFVIKHAGYLT